MVVKKREWIYKGEKRSSWEFYFDIQKKPRKQYRKSGFKTRGEAVEAERKAIIKFKEGESLKNCKVKFKEAASIYIAYVENRYRKETAEKYRGFVKNHLQIFHDKLIEDIAVFDINNWINNQLDEKNPDRISEVLINDCLKMCKALFNYLIDSEIFDKRNPFEKVKKVEEPFKEMQILNIKQANKVLVKCLELFPDDDTYAILYLALFTGLRQGELFGLEINKLDLKTGKAKVRQQYRKGTLDKKLKTLHSYREVDLAPSVITVLENHLKRCPASQRFVFVNQVGNPHSARNFTERRLDKIFEKLAEEKNNDVHRVKFHALRHTYVSLLLSQGVSVKYIQKQVGHSRINTTMDIYAHLVPEVNEHAVNALENIISCEQIVSKNEKVSKRKEG